MESLWFGSASGARSPGFALGLWPLTGRAEVMELMEGDLQQADRITCPQRSGEDFFDHLYRFLLLLLIIILFF